MEIGTIEKLQEILEKNPEIEMIEIWDRVLYLRMRKGRNKFHTKKGITNEKKGIYINLINFKKEYKNAISKFHPDKQERRNEHHTKISKDLNRWKELLCKCNKREFNRAEFNKLITTYTKDTSIFTINESIRIILEEETGFFDGYIKIEIPTDESRAKTAAWWEKETARRCGRNKDGTKYHDPNEGTLPF